MATAIVVAEGGDRAGRDDPQVRKGWEILLTKVLNPGPQGHFDRGSVLTQEPPRLTASKKPMLVPTGRRTICRIRLS